MAIGHAARHYTLEGKLHKVSYTRGAVPEVYGRNCPGIEETDASEKRIVEMKISNYDGGPACV
jgi:hypothetical protein